MMELQEQRYEEIFRLFLEYQASITSVTFWGTSDHYTWLDNFPVRGRKNWPFVFDQQLQPKESFWRLLNAAKGSVPTSEGIS
ncbi:Endo-1,4-beta-xylanase B [compost metagenome]